MMRRTSENKAASDWVLSPSMNNRPVARRLLSGSITDRDRQILLSDKKSPPSSS